MTTHETILVEQRDRVGIITLNRPKVLNALNQKLTEELLAAAETFDRDPAIGCIVITGSEKAFAAGADVNEMQDRSFIDMYTSDWFSVWDRLAAVRTPLVAAVAGFALGGGCELAMICDVILAADTAKFGQPEIKLGVMPGIGGEPTSDALCRQGEGDGNVFDRAHDGRGRGGTVRSRVARDTGRRTSR